MFLKSLKRALFLEGVTQAFLTEAAGAPREASSWMPGAPPAQVPALLVTSQERRVPPEQR